MQEMGFQPDDIARALESASFSFGKALLLLLNGVDEKRAKQDNKARFRRHLLQSVKSIDCQKLANLSVTEQYTQRSQDHYQLRMEVRFRPVRRSNLCRVLLALLGGWLGGEQRRGFGPGSAR